VKKVKSSYFRTLGDISAGKVTGVTSMLKEFKKTGGGARPEDPGGRNYSS